jgi:hypothetical protein
MIGRWSVGVVACVREGQAMLGVQAIRHSLRNGRPPMGHQESAISATRSGDYFFFVARLATAFLAVGLRFAPAVFFRAGAAFLPAALRFVFAPTLGIFRSS